jgi:hypothetical protein
MPSRQKYQQFACECLRFADEADDHYQRQILLEMADAWTVIALEAPLPVDRVGRQTGCTRAGAGGDLSAVAEPAFRP